jgi:hypothetical protein
MTPPRLVLIAGLVLNISLPSTQLWAQSTYDATSKGTTCKSNPQGLRYCTYRVGTLEFGIVGVGTKDTKIHFLHSDIAADYYAQFYVQDGCVVVLPGAANKQKDEKAFVSLSTGKVFKAVEECKGSK